jgi:hypothetical protein
MEELVLKLVSSLSLSLLLALAPITFGLPNVNQHIDQSRLALRDRSDAIRINWSSVRVGDIVAKGTQEGQQCRVPKLLVHTPHIAGKRRIVSLAPNVSCDVIVIDHGESDEVVNSANRHIPGGSVALREWDPKWLQVVLAEQKRPRRSVNIDAEYSHGHVFTGLVYGGANWLVMEVHMSFYFDYGGGFAWLASPGPYPTFAKHPNLDAYDMGYGCDEYAPGVYCTHAGDIPQGYTYVEVTTAGEPDGSTWCDGYTNTYFTYPFYEYEYQC